MKSRFLLTLVPLGAGASALALTERDAANNIAVNSTAANNSTLACPSNVPFTCPQFTTCMTTTNNNDSIICCPGSSDCVVINPISCDVSFQSQPNSVVQSTNLTAGSLKTCGSDCCPHGYDCQGARCVLQNAVSPSSSVSSTVPQSISSSTAPPTVIGTGTVSNSGPQGASSSSHQSLAIGLGVSLGIVLVAALALLFLLLIRRRRRQRDAKDPYLNPDKHHSPEFMGTTPGLKIVDTSMQHSRSISNYSAPSTKKPAASTVSEPMWNDTFNNAPLHRTEFLLRRGSVETGFEQNIKPFWSTRQKANHHSIDGNLNDGSIQVPLEKETRRSHGRNRLTPLFSTPLRFGLPISPKPVGNTQQPTRPPRSDESLARLVTIGGRTVPQGEAIRVENNTPPPSRGKVYNVPSRDRSESQRRPLVRENSYGARAESSERGRERIRDDDPIEMTSTPRDATRYAPGNLYRSKSSSSTATFDSDTSLDKGMDASSETINILLPPPSVFQTPPPPARARPLHDNELMPKAANDTRRETTWSDMMTKAGFSRSEWKK